MKAQGSIVINAPPEKVWPFLVEPEKVLQWSSTYKKFEYVGDQHSGVGTKFHIEEKAGGPLMKIDFETNEWEDNKTLSMRMVSGTGVKSYKQNYLLEKVEQGCKLSFMEEVELPMGFIGKFIGFLGEGMANSTLNKNNKKQKTLAET